VPRPDTPSLQRLRGHVALVTGAGRGIGRAHAIELARQGAQVVVCDIGIELDGTGGDASVAARVVDEIVADGGEAIADTSDVSSFAGGRAAVAAGVAAFGKVDIVINNAGLAGAASIDSVEESDLTRELELHLHGSLGTVKAAWPSMVEQGWGRVINTVSEEAFPAVSSDPRGGIGLLYGPAKAAVWSLTSGLASEGAPIGITVNAISPGAFTRMNSTLFESTPTTLDLDPHHIARVVAWLVGEDASDVTGRVLHVAGPHRREYVMTRRADTALIGRLDAVLG
jgi:NAD(P)-dependent dehydrogenase (short-subunit alcohol dehydrogenase family)